MNFETQIAFSAQQVADLLDVPYATVLREIRTGQLTARRVGKTYRIHRDCLDEYLKCPGQENPPACINAPTQVNGSSGTAAKTPAQDIAAAKADEMLKKLSRATSQKH